MKYGTILKKTKAQEDLSNEREESKEYNRNMNNENFEEDKKQSENSSIQTI